MKFFLLGGPLSCVINSTAGVGTLLLWGSIRPEQVPFTWWTWWVGDSIGVGVAAPLIFILLAHPRDVWRRRQASVGVPLAWVFFLTIGLFAWVNATEQSGIRAEFEERSKKAALAVQSKLDAAVHRVHSLADLYTSVPEVDRSTFSTFARRTLELNPEIHSLSWNPRVAGPDRDSFERHAREAGYPGFRIVEKNPGGRPAPAPPREEYIVVLHAEPPGSDGIPAGYDVASDPRGRAALRRASETGRPSATGRVKLAREKGDEDGILVFIPVYSSGQAPTGMEDRRRDLRGFAIGALRVNEILRGALDPDADPNVRVEVRDEAASDPDRVLWSNGPPATGAVTNLPALQIEREPVGLVESGRIEVGGRAWSIVCRATAPYLVHAHTWRPWITLAGGMLFMGLLAAFLLVVTGKAVIIERFGAERAAELSTANLSLQREIDVRKQAQEELVRKESELRQAQKMEAVGRLAGGIAHDFNNLLTAILGYGNLMDAKLGAASPLREELAEILKAGARATDLTRQLLAFSRRQILVPKVLDLNAVVDEMGNILRRLIGEHIELITRAQPDLGRVRADRSQVEQVIMNLAINARDAMPKGGRLMIETRDVNLDEHYAGTHPEIRPGPYVMLAVTDSGQGMDVETQAKIFEPFFTTKERGKGTGLGLSTVYGIVKQSGGHVAVYSEPGQGSVFKVYLPRVEGRAEARKAPADESAPQGGSETVMVVEDEESVRSLICSVLKAAGYEVFSAGNGPEALEEFRKTSKPVHLLITDIVMPGMYGRELAGILTAAHPGLRVLFVSGYTENGVLRPGGLDEGAAFLSKPFLPETLMRAVREVMDGG
jgi:signal transduction histidine kinase